MTVNQARGGGSAPVRPVAHTASVNGCNGALSAPALQRREGVSEARRCWQPPPPSQLCPGHRRVSEGRATRNPSLSQVTSVEQGDGD